MFAQARRQDDPALRARENASEPAEYQSLVPLEPARKQWVND